MQRPEVKFTQASDGAYLAYQSFGDGPIEFFLQEDTFAYVDQWWDSVAERAWHEGLADLGRVTIYDRRGLGLSSRDVALGDLETQVEDTIAVLDAQGIERAVLVGILESGAPNALLAASHPSRVQSVVWIFPAPRTTATDDYPWGASPEYLERERDITRHWGTERWARAFIELNAGVVKGIWSAEEYVRFMTQASRRSCTPDVAALLNAIWAETDVRGILSSIRAESLLVFEPDPIDVAVAAAMADLLPNAQCVEVSGFHDLEQFAQVHEVIRTFVGAQRPVLDLDTVLATVMFTDIVDSTKVQGAIGDHAWNQLIDEHHAIVRQALDRWRGRENDTAGDGFYATFDGPARALRCGLEIVEAVRDLGIEVRVGVHTGECSLVDGKYAGIAVTTGARIMSLAGPSQVLISQTVKDLVAGSGLSFESVGERDLKGVPNSYHLYEVIG